MSDRKSIVRRLMILNDHEPADVLIESADRIAALEAENAALTKTHKRFHEVLNDAHDVPPEHDSEPVPFHKGWELAIRAMAAALIAENAEEKVTESYRCVYCDLNIASEWRDGRWGHPFKNGRFVPCVPNAEEER